MATLWHDEGFSEPSSYSGKLTRRRWLGLGAAAAGALGASMLMEPPWRAAFGRTKPYKVGSLQSLTGPAASAGRMAALGAELAIARINKAGGINGRPVQWILEDDQGKPDTGVRKLRKLLLEDQIDVHEGIYLSNICLACMPLFAEARVVNVIGTCNDTSITTTRCSRYTFRPLDYSLSEAKAFVPYLVRTIGKRFYIVYVDYAYGQSARDAYVKEIEKHGGTVVGTLGIPLGTADMMPYLSRINGSFDGLLQFNFALDAVTMVNQGFDLGLFRKYRWAGSGAVAEPSQLPAMGHKVDGFIGIGRYAPVFQGSLNTEYHRRFFTEAKARAAAKGYTTPHGPVDPDRWVQSNFESVNLLKIGMTQSGFRSRDDSLKLVGALEGAVFKASDDFPQGEMFVRKEDHQGFIDMFIYEVRDGQYTILETIPWRQTVVPAACTFTDS